MAEKVHFQFSPPGENNSSCAVESDAGKTCAVDLYEKVAHLSFRVRVLKTSPKGSYKGHNGDFSAERAPF